MNSAKKIMKNGGENATQSTVKQSRGLSKNMILILVGIILVAVLGGGVCYVNLRPRAILTVEGKDADGKTVTHTINYPEAMYDIYQAEAMASMYQMYGMSFDWSDTTEDGDTYAALYKKQIMQTLKKREILYMCAQKKGMTLTDEEKKTIKEDVKSARKNMTDSQKAMKGLDEATITTVKEKDKLGEKYKDSIVSTLKIDKDKLKKSVDKKSYRQYTLQYYTFAKTETGSDNKTKDKDAKTLEQGKKDMIALQKKAASAKDFTKDVITDKDNDKVDDNNKGISYSTKDLIETDTDFLDNATRKTVKAMKNGAVSGLIETKDAYYVIKMVNNKTRLLTTSSARLLFLRKKIHSLMRFTKTQLKQSIPQQHRVTGRAELQLVI